MPPRMSVFLKLNLNKRRKRGVNEGENNIDFKRGGGGGA